MSKLLVHVGYPKTGTKSIQTGWLYPLHKNSIINFIGMFSWPSADINEGSIHFDREFAGDRDKLKHDIEISESKLNVISDEGLTEPLLYKHRRHKLYEDLHYRGESDYDKEQEISPFDYPKELQNYFEDMVDEVAIWITIRNQQTHINSMYAQYNEYFIRDSKRNTWEKYLDEILSSNKTIFDYSSVIDTYIELFGRENVHITLFEDFKNDKKKHCDELSGILEIDRDILIDLADIESHKNKKKADQQHRYVEDISLAGRFVDSALNTIGVAGPVKSGLQTAIGENNYDTIINSLFNKEQAIEKPSNKDKKEIKQKFDKSNRRLATEFGISESKLKKYGYI